MGSDVIYFEVLTNIEDFLVRFARTGRQIVTVRAGADKLLGLSSLSDFSRVLKDLRQEPGTAFSLHMEVPRAEHLKKLEGCGIDRNQLTAYLLTAECIDEGELIECKYDLSNQKYYVLCKAWEEDKAKGHTTPSEVTETHIVTLIPFGERVNAANIDFSHYRFA